ncbi:MAG: lipopolysaccharide biosynthesis protein [Sphingobium sp.]
MPADLWPEAARTLRMQIRRDRSARRVASPPNAHGPRRSRSPLQHILRNTGWLLGGKGLGALCGIAYLAILAKGLGLKDFGHFSLIVGTSQALIAFAGFQTTRVMVRYGVRHVHHTDWDRLGRLTMVCGLLDAASAMIGCIIALVAIMGFPRQLDLNPAYVAPALWFCCASCWTLASTPTGLMRALNRFDVAMRIEAVVPVGRLVAALLIWWAGPSVERFLLAWLLIDTMEALLYWLVVRHICPRCLRFAHLRNWRDTFAENERLWQFLRVTYVSSTLDGFVKNGPVLAIGAFLSTSGAGLYRLAAQLSGALNKLSSLLARSVYAEMARLHVAAEPAKFRRFAAQGSLIAGCTGIVVILAALQFGPYLLGVIGGKDFIRGAAILVPLTIAASAELAGVVFEPILHSAGRVSLSLLARGCGAVMLAIGLACLIHTGPSGAAWAVAAGALASYLALGLLAWRALTAGSRRQR